MAARVRAVGWLRLVGLLILLSAAATARAETAMEHAARHLDPTYTCPMHPQIRSGEPGNCPICGMQLIPLARYIGDAGRVELTARQRRVLGVRTVPAGERPLYRELKTVAEVTYDDRNLVEVTARVNGEVERYYNFFEGDIVRKGAVLIDLKSPELMRVVQDYAQAMRAQGWVERLGSDMPQINATSTVTLLWRGLSEEDIKTIARTGELMEHFAIRSPVTGVVVEQDVNNRTLVNAGVQGGQFTAIGESIVKIAELDTMWVQAELLGPDLERVKTGDPARVRVHGLPDRIYEAPVSFVYPDVDRQRRTRIARIVLPNEDTGLVPGMYADVTFRLPVSPAEGVAAGHDGNGHAAHAHDEAPAGPTAPGEPAAPVVDEATPAAILAIPRAAVIDTGDEQFVFVESDDDVFTVRPVKLGLPAGDLVPVHGGLHPGERVVVQGQFFLQAEVELRTTRGGGAHGGHGH